MRRRLHLPVSPALIPLGLVALYLLVAPAGDASRDGVTPSEAIASTDEPGASSLARAFEFELEDINPGSATHGRKLALADLYRERGVVLRFVASWCQICREELPEIQEIYAGRNAPIILMAADEYGAGQESMLVVASRNSVTVPILFVPEPDIDRMEEHYAYQALPATYFIDREGRVRSMHQGKMDGSRLMEEMESALGLPG